MKCCRPTPCLSGEISLFDVTSPPRLHVLHRDGAVWLSPKFQVYEAVRVAWAVVATGRWLACRPTCPNRVARTFYRLARMMRGRARGALHQRGIDHVGPDPVKAIEAHAGDGMQIAGDFDTDGELPGG